MNPRFFFDQDQDSHWWMIASEMRPKWEKWKNSEVSYPMPKNVARPLEGHPRHVTFEMPYESK